MVDLRNCKWDEFLTRLGDRHLYCFGSGELAKWLSAEVCGHDISSRIVAFVDNNELKSGTYVNVDGREIPVMSYQDFLLHRNKDSVMLITNMYYSDILEQMDGEEALSGMECYIEVFLKEEQAKVSESELFTQNERTIPKVIHYCWFGKQEIPEVYKQYIASWKKYCPDYEIVRWDERNYDYTKIPYTRQAYEAGKYAFVSDYARLDIVYNHGGIYLDIDVEITRNLDLLLGNDMFCGFEKGNVVNTGLGFGAKAGFAKLGEMRAQYHDLNFFREDGSLTLTACTKYQTDYLTERGLKRNGKLQIIDGIRVFPRTVLAPFDFYGVDDFTSKETFSVHHYAATWFSKANHKELLLKRNDELRERMNGHVE